MSTTLSIGLHMKAGDEVSCHLIDGALRYLAEQPDLRIRDYRFRDPGTDSSLSRPPRWLSKVDGVLASVRRLPSILPWFRSGRVPVVTLGTELYKDTYGVRLSPRSLATLAVEHFLGLGRRHFAYVGYPPSDGSRDRRQTLAAELSKHGLGLQGYEMHALVSGTCADFATLDEVEPELIRLIRDAEKPLAVVTPSDQTAAMVCRIAEALGLAIPDDVAVLGDGDSKIARDAQPPLSSLRAPLDQMGYEAARLLHRLMRGEVPKRRKVCIPATELVERESTVGKRRAKATDMERVLEFIRQKGHRSLVSAEVAAHVHVPRRTLEMHFAAATGKTLGKAIRDVRLERAKTLLETTDLRLSTVARLLGMNSGSALNSFVLRFTGTMPGKYRRQHRGAV